MSQHSHNGTNKARCEQALLAVPSMEAPAELCSMFLLRDSSVVGHARGPPMPLITAPDCLGFGSPHLFLDRIVRVDTEVPILGGRRGTVVQIAHSACDIRRIIYRVTNMPEEQVFDTWLHAEHFKADPPIARPPATTPSMSDLLFSAQGGLTQAPQQGPPHQTQSQALPPGPTASSPHCDGGHDSAYADRYSKGFDKAYTKSYGKGYFLRYCEGSGNEDMGYTSGYSKGYDKGYAIGLQVGFYRGSVAGSCHFRSRSRSRSRTNNSSNPRRLH